MGDNDKEENKGLSWWAWLLIILAVCFVLYEC